MAGLVRDLHRTGARRGESRLARSLGLCIAQVLPCGRHVGLFASVGCALLGDHLLGASKLGLRGGEAGRGVPRIEAEEHLAPLH